MNRLLTHIDCGESIPIDNPHSLSVSLPTISDVIGYEEGDLEILNKMKSGYPRFFRNKLVQQLVDYVQNHFSISSSKTVLPITSLKALKILEYLIEDSLEFVEVDGSVFIIIDEANSKLQSLKDYIRNAGLIISSRQAEQALMKLNLLNKLFDEEKLNFAEAFENVEITLSDAYNIKKENIILANSGANALFSVCEALVTFEKDKNTIVQLGWLYVDTMEVIEKRSQNTYLQLNVFDLNQLDIWLTLNHSTVAVLVTEVVSNPKIQCVDIITLYDICKKYGIKLVLDTTLITPFIAPVLQYCDIAVESLSKFASGNADVLMGAIVISDNCNFSKTAIQEFVVSPFAGEVERLGIEILGYRQRVEKISHNTRKLIDFFSKHEEVDQVLSVYSDQSKFNFEKLSQNNLLPGLISVVFKDKLSNYYDVLRLAKGPSLGTEFTLAMPYVYLAHYDLIQTIEGRSYLSDNGIDTELLRISVGLEPIEEIIEVFDLVLKNKNLLKC